jgi:hypothetical protein
MNTKPIYFITSLLMLFLILAPSVSAQTSGEIYTIYGGNNAHDSIGLEWTAGSDNVVWNFGQTGTVYRLIKSLSLRYNPDGYFYITRSEPIDLGKYTWLTFVGRSNNNNLDFSVQFLDGNKQPIGISRNFSNHGGEPSNNYWTQYNFPISMFQLNSDQVYGIQITQLSSGWGATIYLDEIYLAYTRGENINPALPTPTPTPNITTSPPVGTPSYLQMSPWVLIIPALVLALAVIFQ